MGWKVGLVCVVLFFLFFWKGKQEQKKDREKLGRRLEEEWGKPTRVEYSDKIWGNITAYDDRQEGERGLDTITWNDLNLSEIFQQMNHTRTSAGESMLYHILRTPLLEEEELLHREKMILALSEEEEKRKELEQVFCDIGKVDGFSVYDALLQVEALKPFSKVPHLFCAGLLCVGVVLIPILQPWYLLVFLAILLFDTFFYFHEKGKHVRDITLFPFLLHLLKGCEQVGNLVFPGLEDELQQIREQTEKFQTYRRFSFFVAYGKEMSGSIFDSLFDYLRILFHLDLIKISTMVWEVKTHEQELLSLYREIGMLDAMLAVASYRKEMVNYAIPKFLPHMNLEEREKSGMCYLQTRGLYHPLVGHPVKNDLFMKHPILLTGSNASGKSTFLKAVAISLIFAQTIHTVLADWYEAPFYRVFSSMALRDNLLARESYFMVEIKSLKRLFEEEERGKIPVFCFVDEILRGTNTVERVAASSMFLEVLAHKNAICMAATHDMELTYLLEGIYENYHFEEKVECGDVFFDYRLKQGRARSRNAILLMENLGFGEELTGRAKQRAEYFLTEGKWK